MSELKEKSVKTKKKLSRSALVLIFGLIIIAVPVIIFLSILGISYLNSGSPRDGSRFEGDLDPAITNADLDSLQSDIEGLGTFDEVTIICKEGQLKIFIDTPDSYTEQQVDSLLTAAYNKVNSRLPVSQYFTATESKKMYDLQINVYTTSEASEIEAANSRQYKLLHKNSAEDAYGIDDMAHPKNAQLAAELEGRIETPTGSDTGTAGDGGEELTDETTETTDTAD
jgi:hypothetical protein